MTTSVRWIVTTSSEHSLHDIERQLTKTSFSVEQVLTEICCITGAAPANLATQLRTIPDVSDLSLDESIDIGPPNDSVIW